MKTIVFMISIMMISLIDSYAQWYTKKYFVNDINLLSATQLQESLAESKRDLLYSGCIAVAGGAFILAAKYGDNQPDENPRLFEQIIGERGIETIAYCLGIGMLTYGAIKSVIHITRINQIKTVISEKFPALGSLEISPAIILNRCPRTHYQGFTISYRF